MSASLRRAKAESGAAFADRVHAAAEALRQAKTECPAPANDDLCPADRQRRRREGSEKRAERLRAEKSKASRPNPKPWTDEQRREEAARMMSSARVWIDCVLVPRRPAEAKEHGIYGLALCLAAAPEGSYESFFTPSRKNPKGWKSLVWRGKTPEALRWHVYEKTTLLSIMTDAEVEAGITDAIAAVKRRSLGPITRETVGEALGVRRDEQLECKAFNLRATDFDEAEEARRVAKLRKKIGAEYQQRPDVKAKNRASKRLDRAVTKALASVVPLVVPIVSDAPKVFIVHGKVCSQSTHKRWVKAGCPEAPPEKVPEWVKRGISERQYRRDTAKAKPMLEAEKLAKAIPLVEFLGSGQAHVGTPNDPANVHDFSGTPNDPPALCPRLALLKKEERLSTLQDGADLKTANSSNGELGAQPMIGEAVATKGTFDVGNAHGEAIERHDNDAGDMLHLAAKAANSATCATSQGP
jgi:hypothetical protein